MNKKQLSLLLIGMLLASVAVAAGKSTKKIARGMPVTTAAVPKTVVKPWEPTAFVQDGNQLPPNYSGLDPVEFFAMFKSKVGNLNKGEFETSKEFAQRTSDIDALLSPINTSNSYAFLIKDIAVKYDADTQAYLIGGVEPPSFFCHETYTWGEFKDWITCRVSHISRDDDTYIGSNAYGASLTVERTRGLDFAIAIAKGSAAQRTILPRWRDFLEAYWFQDKCPVPVEKARDLKDMKVAVLFVGRIIDAKIVEGRGVKETPTIDSPYDIFISEEAVPFELKKVIYYVIQTGEILGQKNF